MSAAQDMMIAQRFTPDVAALLADTKNSNWHVAGKACTQRAKE